MIAHEQIPHSGDGTSFIRLIHHQLMLLPVLLRHLVSLN